MRNSFISTLSLLGNWKQTDPSGTSIMSNQEEYSINVLKQCK